MLSSFFRTPYISALLQKFYGFSHLYIHTSVATTGEIKFVGFHSALLRGRPVVVNWWCEGMRLTTCIAHKNVLKKLSEKWVPTASSSPESLGFGGSLGFAV